MNTIEKQISVLKQELSELHRQRDVAQLEVAKSYADAFIRKLEAAGIPLAIGQRAFRDLAKVSGSPGRAAERRPDR